MYSITHTYFSASAVVVTYSPIRRKTTTLNMDSKVGMTTPNTTPSFLAGLAVVRSPSLPAVVVLCLDHGLETGVGSGPVLLVSR